MLQASKAKIARAMLGKEGCHGFQLCRKRSISGKVNAQAAASDLTSDIREGEKREKGQLLHFT